MNTNFINNDSGNTFTVPHHQSIGDFSYDAGMVTSGYVGIQNAIDTEKRRDDDKTTTRLYLLPISKDVAIHADLTLNRPKDNATLRVWIDAEDIEDNDFVNHFDVIINIDKDLYVTDKTSVGFKDNVLSIVLMKREELTPKKVPVLR